MSALQRIYAMCVNSLPQTRKLATKAQRKKSKPPESLGPFPFPEKLLYKKQRTPHYMYISDARAAALIDTSLEPFLRQLPPQCDIALELNPGTGVFTEKLLQRKPYFRKVLLFETLDHFIPKLQELQALHPERLQLRQADFVGIWKSAYQDKMDNGTRVTTLLHDVPKRAHDDVPNVAIFGAIGSYQFFKHLVNSLVFQNSLLSWGRCEMFLVIPPPIYVHLTCRNEIGLMFYRSTSMLFQMLFEYRFITQLPREYFLPMQTKYSAFKGSKLGIVKSINPEYLYLVKIVPRRNIFELCSSVDLPALWYFVKQNCVSRRNRVIPNLEKLVPGCGPRLIINTQQPVPVQPLYADEDVTKLPKFSHRCTTMSCRDFFPNINIYTQFGDLSPSQMLTLFTQFRNWSEYSESSFLASLENSLLRLEASADESIESIGLTEEDDASSDLLHMVEATSNEEGVSEQETIVDATTKNRKHKTTKLKYSKATAKPEL